MKNLSVKVAFEQNLAEVLMNTYTLIFLGYNMVTSKAGMNVLKRGVLWQTVSVLLCAFTFYLHQHNIGLVRWPHPSCVCIVHLFPNLFALLSSPYFLQDPKMSTDFSRIVNDRHFQ